MIKVTINNICAKLTECEPLTSGMIGKLVEVSFSPEWSGLNKIAVFSNGDVTKDLLESQWNGNYIPIPWEVLATPNRSISMGVYGYTIVDGEKVLAIPTIVAEIGKTKFGADPSDDPAADPTLPIWVQLQTEVDDLDDRVTDLEEHGGGGQGWTTEQIDLLEAVFEKLKYTDAEGGAIAAQLINSLRGGVVPEEPITITFDGTTAVISGLASTNINHSGTTAKIGYMPL